MQKCSDRPSSSNASEFNKMETFDFLSKIEVENSHIVLEKIEIAKISNLSACLGKSVNKSSIFTQNHGRTLKIEEKTFRILISGKRFHKKNFECDFCD